MLYVSIFVELLRSRPALAIWLAALAQAALWTLVPTLFYSGPPGELPQRAGGRARVPARHLSRAAARLLAGRARLRAHRPQHVRRLSAFPGLHIVTYWAVFALGRAIVGAQHAALAVLLMVGVSAFAVPTPDFGPAILTMPLWAIILLHYWRAVGEGRRGYWLVLAIEIGLLAADDLCRADAGRPARAVHACQVRARATLRSYRSLDRGGGGGFRHVSASRSGLPIRASLLADARAAACAGSGGR